MDRKIRAIAQSPERKAALVKVYALHNRLNNEHPGNAALSPPEHL